MEENDQSETCQNCRFWDPQWKFRKEQKILSDGSKLNLSNPRMTENMRKNSPKGLCRRHAPHPSALTTVWMETQNADWCGDFSLHRSKT